MTDIDRVWTRLKDRAARYAERHKVLTVSDARFIVIETCREQRTDRPPPNGLERLADTLVRLTRLRGYTVNDAISLVSRSDVHQREPS
jgi:hypothetical protein